ncbi:MAG: FtsX-like permease family protein [bacterium]|nr:FtsX-like permease family protein [bacterium]
MLFIALKNLFQEKTRLLISVGGVAFSALLIIVLVGLYQGWQNKMGEYIRNLPADLWVAQEGSKDMFHSVSVISLEDENKIKSIEGVSQVAAFSGRQLEVDFNGKQAATYVVGFDTSSRVGGPLRVIKGKSAPSNGEIIIDKIFADDNDLEIGDRFPIGTEEFEVAGISEGGSLITFQYSFVTKEDAERLFKLQGVTNYFMVTLLDDSKSGFVAKRIKELIPSTKVFTRREFVDKNTEIVTETFLPIILVLVLIGFAVGVAVIGLTIFTSTIEKSREYGVLKAIGIRNSQLYLIVVQQALVAGVAGYLIGLGFAFSLSLVVGQFVPEFITLFRVIDIVWIFGATLLMAILAAFVPSRRIAHINPAEVFKA